MTAHHSTPASAPHTTSGSKRRAAAPATVLLQSPDVVTLNITCSQVELDAGLGIVSQAVSKHPTLPVLGNIALFTDNGRLRVQGTDLETGLTSWIPAHVKGEGAITISAAMFTRFVHNLPRGTVELTVTERDQTLHLKCGGHTATFKGIDADEFPELPMLAGIPPLLSLPAKVLSEAIDQVAFAAATDNLKPVLAGVLVKLVDNVGTLTATDGFTLSEKQITLPTLVATPLEVLIPAQSLIRLSSAIGTSDETIDVLVTPNQAQVLFHSARFDLVTRVIEGKYPDYRRAIPQQYLTRTVIQRGALKAASKLACVFAAASNNVVKIQCRPSPGGAGTLLMGANASEVGDNLAEIQGTMTGQGGQMAFNVKFMQAIIAEALTAREIAFEMTHDGAPGVFRQVGDDSLLVVVWPIKLQ